MHASATFALRREKQLHEHQMQQNTINLKNPVNGGLNNESYHKMPCWRESPRR